MDNILTIVKSSIGIYGGIVDLKEKDDVIYLNNPVAFDIMMVPSQGKIQGTVGFNPQWIGYQLWTPQIEINLTPPYIIYDILLDEENFIGNIYKKVRSQIKTPPTKIH